MIDEDTIRLARTAFYARARAIKQVRYGDPIQRVFTVRDIRRGAPEVEIAPWLNEQFGDHLATPVLYSLTANEVEVATALRQAFVLARNVRPRICSLPRHNEGHPIETTLYVGQSQNIRTRLNCAIPEHCIDARRLPLFIARSALRDLIAGLQTDAKGVQAA